MTRYSVPGASATASIETCTCPRCGQPSALGSCDEVDVGIGVMRGNESWECPEHGLWMVLSRPDFNGHAFAFEEGYALFRARPYHRYVTRSEYGSLPRPSFLLPEPE